MRQLPSLGAFLIVMVAACTPATPNDSPAAPKSDSTRARLTPPLAADTATASTEVELRTDKTHYRAGESVTMSFVNRSAAQFTFNPCPRVIEAQSGDRWLPVAEPPRFCTMEAWILNANETRTAMTRLPDPLTAGTMRIVVGLSKEGQAAPAGGVLAISQPLTIDK